MAEPLAVIMGDIHFTVPTLELASASVLAGQRKAEELGVPLILNGDTLDSKAIIRGECASRLIDLLSDSAIRTYVNTGNHDLWNEKGKESSLKFLSPYCQVISSPVYVEGLDSTVIPYQTTNEAFAAAVAEAPKNGRLIIHQGIQSAHLGHYTVDKTSAPKEVLANYRTIASHYHRQQNIECGPLKANSVGLLTYCGSPYTISFSEASDGPKGFQVLFDDGHLEFHELPLRRHIVVDMDYNLVDKKQQVIRPEDLVWVKLTSTPSQLAKIKKEDIAAKLGITNFKLDKIPKGKAAKIIKADTMTEKALLDSIIDGLEETDEQKIVLKTLWRDLCV